MIKTILLPLIVVFCFIYNYSFSQVTLDYAEIGIKFKPKKDLDTIELTTVKFGDNFKCIIYLHDIWGSCNFKIFNSKGQLYLEGQYSGCKDTLTQYRLLKQLGVLPSDTITYGVRRLNYFYPLKYGDWYYYKTNGQLNKHYFYKFEKFK